MKLYNLVAFILIFSYCVLAQDASLSSAKQIKQSLVSITVYERTGNIIRHGIGLFVNDEGDILVHKSVVEDGILAEIQTSDGKIYPLTKLLTRDLSAEMALFSTLLPKGTSLRVKIGKAFPKVNDQILTAALNEQFELTLILGEVKSRKQFSMWENLEVKSQLLVDAVGNPVFNLDGELVGLVAVRGGGEQGFTVRTGERIVKLMDEIAAAKVANPDQQIRNLGEPLLPDNYAQLGELLVGKASKREPPIYPKSAKASHITGTVIVQVTVNEEGGVVKAEAIDGHFQRPMNVLDADAKKIVEELKKAAVEAAHKWKFAPTKIGSRPMPVIGTITFNFLP